MKKYDVEYHCCTCEAVYYDPGDAATCCEYDRHSADIAAILDERGKRYGDFHEHARITQAIKGVMMDSNNWQQVEDDQREALEMIAHKLGRILNGDPDYADSWVDIAGYAQLVADRLEGAA